MRSGRLRVSWRVLIGVGVLLVCDRTGLCLLTLLAAFLHECGHLAAARILHIPWQSLRLDLLGARREVGGRMLSAGEEWLLSLAGPLSSLAFAALASPLWQLSSAARLFSGASLLLGLLNLLPIRGFDGGRMLECFVGSHLGVRATHTLTTAVSGGFLFLLWAVASYFLLRVGNGLALFCFSVSLLLRFLESEDSLA